MTGIRSRYDVEDLDWVRSQENRDKSFNLPARMDGVAKESF